MITTNREETIMQQQSSTPNKRDIRFNCPVSARCGGCQLSRLSYREQLQRKQTRVQALLGKLCPVEPIIGMEDPSTTATRCMPWWPRTSAKA